VGQFWVDVNSRRQAGVAYLALLILLAAMGAASATFATIWHTSQQREKEKELLHIGLQFRRAIMQYYESSLGEKKYPQRLEDLLSDRRFAGERRYLRRIYRDPMTQKTAWGIVPAPGGGIMGVYSLSNERALKKDGFPVALKDFTNKGSYTEWKFTYDPPQPPSGLPSTQSPPTSKTGNSPK
jgi:type II secretory pathway pseudopilin PulG